LQYGNNSFIGSRRNKDSKSGNLEKGKEIKNKTKINGEKEK
jgi:hypothetical protein